MDQLIAALGVDETTLAIILVIVSMFSRLIAKLIPDNATGLLGFVRRITAVVGLYVSNRLTLGVTQVEAIKQVGRVAERAKEAVDSATVIVKGADGKFKKKKKN